VTRRLNRTWPQDITHQWNRLNEGDTSFDVSPCTPNHLQHLYLILCNDVDCKLIEAIKNILRSLLPV
jgi:hypothetical protein